MAFDHLVQVAARDDEVVDALCLIPLNLMLHDRLAGNGNHRLGNVGGQRPQAFTPASGDQDGVHAADLQDITGAWRRDGRL